MFVCAQQILWEQITSHGNRFFHFAFCLVSGDTDGRDSGRNFFCFAKPPSHGSIFAPSHSIQRGALQAWSFVTLYLLRRRNRRITGERPSSQLTVGEGDIRLNYDHCLQMSRPSTPPSEAPVYDHVSSFRCSPVAILVQVLTRLARLARIAIAARSRLQQIINPADISLLQW